MTKPVGYYTDEKGRIRPMMSSKNQPKIIKPKNTQKEIFEDLTQR